MNAFDKISNHVKQHQYRKGRFVGEAPVDRRSKTHFRAGVTPTHAYVRFHHTDILTAYRDGTVRLDCSGWSDAPTTRDAVWTATQKFFHSVALRTRWENGYGNPAATTRGRTYAFYDGITFDADGQLLSEAQPFKAYRADREARKKWDADAAAFKQVFPVLFANPTFAAGLPAKKAAQDALRDSNQWAQLAYYIRVVHGDDDHDPARAWAKFRKASTQALNITIDL